MNGQPYKPGKREYRIVKGDIDDYYLIERREKSGWFWGSWQLIYFPKNLDLEAATRLVEALVKEDGRKRANKKHVIKVWRD